MRASRAFYIYNMSLLEEIRATTDATKSSEPHTPL
jgi:hypothetical protein